MHPLKYSEEIATLLTAVL